MGTENINRNHFVLMIDSAGTLLGATNEELNQAADNSANVETKSTDTTDNIVNYGLTELDTSVAITHVMDAPVAGVQKQLIKTDASTETITVDTGSSEITFNGTNCLATFDGAGEALILRGLSATRWLVLTNTGSVGFAST